MVKYGLIPMSAFILAACAANLAEPPANDRPANDRPANDRPANDRPANDRPANDRHVISHTVPAGEPAGGVRSYFEYLLETVCPNGYEKLNGRVEVQLDGLFMNLRHVWVVRCLNR